MKRSVLMLIGLFFLSLSAMGCRAGGQGYPAQSYNQYQQPGVLGGGYQQPSPTLPNMQQTQQALGQFSRNLGRRFSNGVINRGVNQVINRVFSAF